MLITKQNIFKVHSIGGNRLLLMNTLECRTLTATYMHQGHRKQFRSGKAGQRGGAATVAEKGHSELPISRFPFLN